MMRLSCPSILARLARARDAWRSPSASFQSRTIFRTRFRIIRLLAQRQFGIEILPVGLVPNAAEVPWIVDKIVTVLDRSGVHLTHFVERPPPGGPLAGCDVEVGFCYGRDTSTRFVKDIGVAFGGCRVFGRLLLIAWTDLLKADVRDAWVTAGEAISSRRLDGELDGPSPTVIQRFRTRVAIALARPFVFLAVLSEAGWLLRHRIR